MSFNTTPIPPLIKIKRTENRIFYIKQVSSEITRIQEIFGRLNLVHSILNGMVYIPTNFCKWGTVPLNMFLDARQTLKPYLDKSKNFRVNIIV